MGRIPTRSPAWRDEGQLGMKKLGYVALATAITALGFCLTLQVQASGQAPAAAAPAAALTVPQQNALVHQYCIVCHDDAQKPGGLSLEHFDAAHPDATVMNLMVGKLRAGAMPPPNMPRPNAATLDAFVKVLTSEAATAAVSGGQEKAPATIPRIAKGAAPTVVEFAHTGDEMTVQTQNKMLHTICTQCHIDAIKPGGVTFQHFDMAKAPQNAELADKMIAKLEAGMMPPQSAPKRPDPASIHAFVTSLEHHVDHEAALHPNPGLRTFQRLDRAEYAASVHSMLGLDINVGQWLPPDTMSHNFADVANVQTFSPTLMQGYLDAADQISRLAVGDPGTTASTATYVSPPRTSQMERVAGAPYGTRGGISVVHIFPANGMYRFTVRFYGTEDGGADQIFGMTAGSGGKMDVSIDGQRVALFTISTKMNSNQPHGLELTTPPIEVTSGPHRVSAAFLKRWDGPIDDLLAPQRFTLADTLIGNAPGITTLPHLRMLTIGGPFQVTGTGAAGNTSRQRIFICRPLSAGQEMPCAQKILTRLADEAYRQPVTPHDLAWVMGYYQLGRKQGDFEEGIRMGLQAILASPRFLFRLEPQPAAVRPGQRYPISDAALASRLSYFIWGAPPDTELVQLAHQGRLHEQTVLDAQVRRMLKDPRAFALSTDFAYHWLRLEDVSKVGPDAISYPEYNTNVEDDFIKETELFFNSVVTGDKDVLDLLTADYTYANDDLANYYGIPGVAGPQFRKVSLEGTHRRGLLGDGSIQVETSVANRSDPVLRGKWVLEVLIGQPPPPPPPGVNTNLSTSSPAVQNGEQLSVRQRMEIHRANPVCASCHSVIDPIGLAMENFSPAGHWRIKDSGVPVDTATTLWDGTSINGLDGLVNAMVAHKATFLTVFTENLMVYALGRQMQYYDMPAIRAIVHQAGLNGDRFSSFVLGVVNSDAFRMSQADTLTATNNSRPNPQPKKGR
jgi:mono/diheme cytochrome c family protein